MKSVFCISLAALISVSATAGFAQRLVPPGAVPSVIQQVQTDESFRVNQLEEEVRRLNGQVEELNFMLLQLQEKIRQMEEETEIRLQELEDKQSQADDPAINNDNQLAAKEPERLGKPEPSEENSTSDENDAPMIKLPALPEAVRRGAEPRALGTLTFDKDGNVVDSGRGERLSGLPGIFDNGVEGGAEAAEFGATPAEVLSAGIGELQIRQFQRAEEAFLAFLKAWPNDPDVGKAKFHLGKSYFWQKEYYLAADSHLDAHNNYPESETAPDNLLALGLALAGLNQREVACATYAEVLKQYPEAEPRLGPQVRDEQAAARC